MIVNIAGLSVNTDIDTTHKEFWTLMNLVSQVTSISSFIKELQIYPEWKAAIRKAEFARAIHGTLAIEGSDVKIEQVEKIVQEASPDSTVDKDTEVANALKAYEFIVEWSSSHPEEKIEEAVISQIHSLITRDLNYPANVPGQYRNYTVSFGDPRKESPLKTMADIQENVINLLNFINCEEEQGITMCSLPTLRAIMAHYFITIIHPFSDGNGRVARAVEALILHHYGKLEAYCFPTTAYFYYQQRKQYFELLRQVDNSKDPVSFLIFALQGLSEHLTNIKKNILDQTTRTLIIDYMRQLNRTKQLLKRQQRLMEIAFGLGEMDTDDFWNHPAIKGLFHNVSESTRKRDVRHLLSLSLLKTWKYSPDGKEKTKISANWDVLRTLTLSLDKIPHRP